MKIEAHAEFTLEGCAAAAEVQDALGLGLWTGWSRWQQPGMPF